MLLNERIKHIWVLGLILFACTPTANQAEQQKLRKQQQADSVKKNNPYLILPPDSMYTGAYVKSYSNGVKQFVGYFRFGKRHGTWLSFYSNGVLWSKMEYDRGLKQGKNTAYYSNGKIRQEGYFKNDLRDSVWLFYDSSGTLQECQQCKMDRCKSCKASL